MNLNPSFNLWEIAVGAGVGAALIAMTGWPAVSVLLGAAVVAMVTAWRAKQWPVAVGVVLALWALNAAWRPILPEAFSSPSSVYAGVESTVEDGLS